MILTRGKLGWGNRKNGLEPYGPGGRWLHRAGAEFGHLLGDHLEELGLGEGAELIIIAIDRRDVAAAREFGIEPEDLYADVEAKVRGALGAAVSDA